MILIYYPFLGSKKTESKAGREGRIKYPQGKYASPTELGS
nr:MAG TPA: hypothetical protein [Caudoviricetes sp.]